MVSGTLKMIKMHMIDMGEIIVYQCKGKDTAEVRSRLSLRLVFHSLVPITSTISDPMKRLDAGLTTVT